MIHQLERNGEGEGCRGTPLSPRLSKTEILKKVCVMNREKIESTIWVHFPMALPPERLVLEEGMRNPIHTPPYCWRCPRGSSGVNKAYTLCIYL